MTAYTIFCREAHIKEFFKYTVKKFGGVDVFWNNASVEGSTATPIQDLKIKDFDTTFKVNLKGTYTFTELVDI